MKKHFFLFAFFALFATAAFAGSNPIIQPLAGIEDPVAEFVSATTSLGVEEEAIHCRVFNQAGQIVAECWLCNCNKLYETVWGPTVPTPPNTGDQP
jgi:hypothetical protein